MEPHFPQLPDDFEPNRFESPSWENLKVLGRVARDIGSAGLHHWRAVTLSAGVLAGAFALREPVSEAYEWYDTCYGDADTPEEVTAQEQCRDSLEEKQTAAAYAGVGAVVLAANAAAVGFGVRAWARRNIRSRK